uniref:Shisa family member 4 n=1 Tax=Ficedula albicollis TaxID=59894 RepID=A0A803VQQ5_FICAL
MLLGAGQWLLALGAESSAGQCHWEFVLGTGQCHWVLGSGTGWCHWVQGMGQWAVSGGAGWGCVPQSPPGPAPHSWGSHSPKTIAGIASAVVLFIAIVTTIVCCFMCSCCYLYQRRQHPRTPLQGPEIPLSSYPPAAPPAPVPVDSKAGPSPPQPEPGGPVTLRLLPPQRHHPTSRHSPATPEHEPPRGPSHPPPASGTRLGTPGNPPGAGGGCPCQHWSRLFPALLG